MDPADPELFDDSDECGICGEDHDETVCEHEECRVCGEIPDNCDCEGPEDRFLVGPEIKDHYIASHFGAKEKKS